MDLRGYLSKTKNVKLKLYEMKGIDIFVNWLYQKHVQQGLEGAFKDNLIFLYEAIEEGLYDGTHIMDIFTATGYETKCESMLEEILDSCDIKVLGEYITHFEPISDITSWANQNNDGADLIFQLQEDGYETRVGVEEDTVLIYTKHFEKTGIRYKVVDKTVCINERYYGHDELCKIEKNKSNELFGCYWEHYHYATFVLSDEKYIYLGYTEDYEGGTEPFDITEIVYDLFRESYIKLDEDNIVRMTYDDYLNGAEEHSFFDKILSVISETSEVIF